MITVEMNKDVRTFDPKILGPFTRRQLLSLVIAAAYAIPVAIAVPGDSMIKVLIGCVLAIPAILCGFIDILGLPLLQFVTYCVIPSIVNPKVRKFKSENTYENYLQEAEKSERKNNKDKSRQKTTGQQKKVIHSKKYRHKFC